MKKEIEKQLVFMVIQKAKNYQEVGVDWIRQNDLIRGLNRTIKIVEKTCG